MSRPLLAPLPCGSVATLLLLLLLAVAACFFLGFKGDDDDGDDGGAPRLTPLDLGSAAMEGTVAGVVVGRGALDEDDFDERESAAVLAALLVVSLLLICFFDM